MRGASLLFVVLALAGCGGSDDDDEGAEPGVGEFAATLVRQLGEGDAASAYDTLHPLHKAEVPRALYIRCERGQGLGGAITAIRVDGLYDESATVPGRFGRQPSTAVELKLSLRVEEAAEPEVVDVTVHVFDTDEGSAWVIGAVDYASYMTGICPG